MDHYAVFGHPVGHSLSPRIHRLFAEQTSQQMEYVAQEPPIDGFAEMAARRALPLPPPMRRQPPPKLPPPYQ